MSEPAELRLYSPLQIDVIDRDISDQAIPLEAASHERKEEYLRRIVRALGELQSQEDARNAFTTHQQDWSEISKKIISVVRAVTLVSNRPYGLYLCRSKEDLAPKEADDLKQYIRDQWEQGWGEGYAHCPREGVSLGLYIHFWQEGSAPLLTREQLKSVQKAEKDRTAITEITPDTFWTMIAQGRECCGKNAYKLAQWLEDRLIEMGPEQALNFDYIAHCYRAMAYKYGLWNAASIMCNGCTDDGFTDFRGWLIAQGREVYMAALKDPDSLAEVPAGGDYYCETLCYVGSYAYEQLTGRIIDEEFDPDVSCAVSEKIKPDIEYGDGIDYPYTWSETAAYLPKLCAKYLKPGELEWHIKNHNDTWNITTPEIQTARATAQKSKKIKKDRGDSR